jgi:hypothetical protein
MIRRAWLLLLLVAVSPPPTKGGADKGKVLDRPTLARVESYCVDTASLPDDEVYVVKGFLKEEDKPKGILKKLRWKRIEDCVRSEPDATIRIEFPFLNAVELRAGEAPGVGISISPRDFRDHLKAVLRVHDNSTSRIIYTAEALPLESSRDPVTLGSNLYDRRLDALRRTFEMLIHDLGPVPPHTAKEAR